MPVLGIVTGLAAEARVLGAWRDDARVAVRITGARPGAAAQAVTELEALGVSALLSWGTCAGLDPALRPGDVLVTRPGEVAASEAPLFAAADKARVRASGARIADMESAAVVRSALPGFVVRVVLDEAGFDLPPAARVALDTGGRPRLTGVIAALARSPGSLPATIALVRRYRRALVALSKEQDRVAEIVATFGG